QNPGKTVRAFIPKYLMGSLNRPRPNIISRLKVILVKEHTQIKIILIASYFFSEIELAKIDTHFSLELLS
ncbi:MAG: hypothetical protein ACKO90_20875, partial [Microcystis panniformis]